MCREDEWLECMELRTRKARAGTEEAVSKQTIYSLPAPTRHRPQEPTRRLNGRPRWLVKYLASGLPTLLYGNFIRLSLVLRHLWENRHTDV